MPDQPTFPGPLTARAALRAAAPIGSFYLAEILVGLTDLAVVGALGTEALAAVGLGKTVLLSLLTMGFAVLSAGTVLMAENPSPRRCGEVVLASLVVALPFTAAAVAIGASGGGLLERGGYEPGLVAPFEAYAGVLAWAVAPAMTVAALKNALNAAERTGIIAWLSAGVVLGNLAGSVLLVHGAGSWDGLGVAGAAWATVAVNAAAAAVLAAHCVRRGVVAPARARLGRVLRSVGGVLGLGWAAGAQQGLESVLFAVVLTLLGTFSAAWLAAGAVAFAVMELNYALSGALGEVVAARLARLRAAGHAAALRQTLRLGTALAGGTAALLALLVGLFTDAAVALFAADASPEARGLMLVLLRWTAPFFVFDAWQVFFVHALRGLRRTALPMVVSASCYWAIGLGGGVVLAQTLGLGAPGVWAGFCAGLVTAAAVLGLMARAAARTAAPP